MALPSLPRIARRLRGGTPLPAPLVQPAASPRRFERHCFIAGLHRSGTTLVEHLLQASCAVSVLRADVPENEGQHLQDVVPAAIQWGGPGRFAFAPQMHTAPAQGPEAERQRDRLLACWAPWVDGDAPVLLEKSPPNLVRIPWLRSLFPGARFLIVTRDPRAAAAATLKWAHSTHRELVYHWHVAHGAALETAGEDCVFLRYEDLCADPAAELDRITTALDLPRRDSPLDLTDRFAEIRNSNDRYLADLPPTRYGPGAWDRLGYVMS
ncbi:sulfotransferase [Actibacterium sp. 188UL27-1]|uniref:sulfotransferase family protein n=1 Tax=Actibacterium sp. 188UL27-1 TaxID=2786961 RepID=UPI0019560D30|nr:sulfotransferase [Actibacterium sp. 188UL27-1]MBM7070212.1 sulfotransferase [Actibacterium sp. 188UL27-1]